MVNEDIGVMCVPSDINFNILFILFSYIFVFHCHGKSENVVSIAKATLLLRVIRFKHILFHFT